ILPTGIVAGDLLIIFAELGNTVSAGPLGWTQLFMLNPGIILTGYYKVAVGGDANPVITTGTVTRSSHISYRITGARGSVEAATNAVSLDPPNLAPSWGLEKTLWLVVGGDNSAAATPAPTNYTNLLQMADSFDHNHISSARRLLEVSSENPDAFGGGQEFPVSATVAIQPAP
ncbi:MAG: hypothetical protein Q8R36_01420, partial [bacterium]|nr:hypothetical protein [bacterium]